ncbi:hypothetical protein, partial [Escherichia coli]|uniref:hypothetical protein n=1 Tax=Escherichia coli TaxID=562 RepID=UPI003CE48024
GDFIAGKAASYAIGCDASGSIMFDSDEIGGDKLIIITTEKASKAYLAHLRSRGISYLLCGKNEINFS